MSEGSTTSRRAVGIAAVAAAGALAVLLARSWRIDYPYSIDFQTYWLAGSRILHGEASRIYEAGGGAADGIPLTLAPGEFKNLPIVAAAFAPFGALEYSSAKRLFWWLSVGALVATSVVVGRFLVPPSLGPEPTRSLGTFALLAVMAPTHISLRHGQTTPWIALLVAVWLAFVGRRDRIAGSALAGACLVKFPPLALLALDAVRARWRPVVACVVGLFAAGLLSLALFGPGLHRAYARGVLENRGSVMPGHNNQSLTAIATRLSGPTPVNDWRPRPVAAPVRWAVRGMALVLMASIAWALLGRRSGDRLPFEATAALAFGLLALPLSWDHYFLMLVPGLVASAGWLALEPGARPLLALYGAAYLLLAVPTPSTWLAREATSGWADGLLLSHYGVGAVAALAASAAALRRP